MSDDDSDDDDLLTTPVFRSSDRRRTLAQKKSGNAIEELIRNSKKQLDEASRIQQLQAENNQAEKAFEKIQEEQMSSSTVKRKVEATQSGFFEVEETEQLDVQERKRRSVMLENMKGRYDSAVVDCDESTIVFKPLGAVKSMFYFSVDECIGDLRSILLNTKGMDPKLKQAFISVLEDDTHQLNHVLQILPLAKNLKIPAALSAWMFRVAFSEGIGNVRSIGQAACNALWTMQRGAADLSDPIFQIEQLQRILGCWCQNEGGADSKSGCNKTGLTNLLRVVSQLPPHPTNREMNPDATAFQETLTDLCAVLSKSNGYRDLNIMSAAEEVQAMLSTRVYMEQDIQQLASCIMKDPQSVPDPWDYYPSVAKLVPCFREGEMLDTAACSMNAHLSMQALRQCLEGDALLDNLLLEAFRLVDGVEDVDLVEKPLKLKAMVSSYAAMQALKSNLEGLNSVKEANPKRCFAVGQAAVLAFTSGILLLGSRIQDEEGGKEYGTREDMSSVFSLCDKLETPLDFLTSYSNRYSADEHFRRLNCWLMVLDFYRLETLKKLKPKFDDDTLVQKNLTSFFTKVST